MIPRYSRPHMSKIWDESSKWASWARVERAHLQALTAEGSCPEGVIEDFDRAVRAKGPDDFLRRENETAHDVIAFVAEIGEDMGPQSGHFLHRGLTSSDVVDTALALRTIDAIDELDSELLSWRLALAAQAFKHANTVTIGRTHGIHAEPCSFGQILAGYAAEAARAHKLLLEARSAVSFGKLSGAVGSYSQLTPAFERRVLSTLGLQPEPAATQVIPRDRLARVAQATEAVVAVVERFALNVRHWARTELGEVLEPFQEKQKGSSAMPHKRNPILAENLCGLARLARGYSATLLQNTALWHERDITHSSVERVAVSDLFIAVDFMLSRVTKLTVGLNVSPDAMMRNLNTTGGLWASGTVLTRLVEAGMSRTTAYETVQALALPLAEASRSGHLPADAFAQALLQNQVIKATLSHEQVSSCFATERFLRSVDVVFERVFGVSPKGLRWDPSASAFPAERVPTLRRIVAAHVSLQPDVLDTEARAIKNDMDHHLKGVLTVRQRKTFLVELPPQSAGRELGAAQLTRVPDVAAYARSVLCNEVMEEIQIEVLQ